MSSFVLQSARVVYIATICIPDLTFWFIISPQVITGDNITTNCPKNYTDLAKRSFETGLNFVALDALSLYIASFADTGFESNAYPLSQLGFMVTPMDMNNNEDTFYYSTFKSIKITRNVFVAK